METCSFDIVVVGGGPSGVCAALSAARMGKQVALVTNRPVLGGNSSSEIRIWTRGAVGGGNLYAEEMGIWGELKLRNLEVNAEGNVIFWDDVLLDAVLAEPRLRLFLNTHVLFTSVQGDRIAWVEAVQLGSERAFRVQGKLFVDCTGDGSVAAAAGIPFHIGQEARGVHDEPYAPDTASPNTLSSTIIFYTRREDHPVRFVLPAYASAYDLEAIQRIIDKGGRVVNENQTGSDYWWFEYGGTRDTIRDAQAIDLELKKLVFGVWNYIKNSGHFPAECLTLEWVGNIAGKRESRRMLSDYTVTRHNLTHPTALPDTGFYGGWFLDAHPPEGMLSEEDNCTQIPVRAYPMPLRALFHSKCPNLLFAGRILGATHAAFISSRIMNTCALSGQAAGTLASFCAEHGCAPAQEVSAHAQEIQTRLAADDMLILGRRGTEPSDIAPACIVTASSCYAIADEGKQDVLSLDAPVFLCLSQAPSKTPVPVTLYADCQAACTFTASLFEDDLPSRLVPGKPLGVQRISLAQGADLPFQLLLPPCDADRFVTVTLPTQPGAALHSAPFAPTGFLMGHQQTMDHRYPRLQANMPNLYRPEQVLSGYNRPYRGPNLWIAGWEAQPWLQLEWEEERDFSHVRLYLNPDFSREMPSSFARQWGESHNISKILGVKSPLLARDIAWFVRQDGRWQKMARLRDNWRRVVDFRTEEPIRASAIKLVFAASAAAPAQVFEVRIK